MTAATFLYNQTDPAAAFARARDDAFFARHPKQTVRVRPLFEGESPLAEGMRGLGTGWRAYAIVIDHRRARDRRAVAGRGVYPVIIRDDASDLRWLLTQEASRWARWFRKHITTPPPIKHGHGVVLGAGAG